MIARNAREAYHYMKVPFSLSPDISELEIRQSCRSPKSDTGPEVKGIRREELQDISALDKAAFFHRLPASLAYHILGIGEGDEVIVPAYNIMPASASPVSTQRG